MYKYDDMKSSHFSVTSDLVSGCFGVDIGRFALRESEVKAVYRAWPHLGFLTNQRAWICREPAVNQSEAIKGCQVRASWSSFMIRVHAENLRAENPWTEISICKV